MSRRKLYIYTRILSIVCSTLLFHAITECVRRHSRFVLGPQHRYFSNSTLPPPDLYERKTRISKSVGPRINGHDAFYTMIIVIRSFDAFHNAVRDLPRWFSCGPWRDGCCRSSTTMTDVRRRRRRAEWNAAEQHWWRITCRRGITSTNCDFWPTRTAELYLYTEKSLADIPYTYTSRAHTVNA